MGNKVSLQTQANGSWTVVVVAMLVAGIYSLATGAVSLFTPDQKGYRFYEQGEFGQAANQFTDPMWTGIALFRQGEFEKSAGIFAGMDTAPSTFNHGNALLMQGKYAEAA